MLSYKKKIICVINKWLILNEYHECILWNNCYILVVGDMLIVGYVCVRK